MIIDMVCGYREMDMDCYLSSSPEQHDRLRGVEPLEGERGQDVRLWRRGVPRDGVRGGGPGLKEGLHRQGRQIRGQPHHCSHGLSEMLRTNCLPYPLRINAIPRLREFLIVRFMQLGRKLRLHSSIYSGSFKFFKFPMGNFFLTWTL